MKYPFLSEEDVYGNNIIKSIKLQIEGSQKGVFCAATTKDPLLMGF
jgi:hypothetical protein